MNYQETLDYLYAQLPMFSRVGAAAYKKDLTNTLKLCEALGNPQLKFKSVHIAGTNGKGSVSHMLASVMQENGYKTGLYTSPHIKEFTERIRINGLEVETDWIIDFVEKNKGIIEEVKPSFFEITVVMSFQYFAEQDVDIAIIETGLGGRLDSTNVVTPLLSVITNIGLDHTDMLGDTLALIAGEKAGIIKKNVPVIISETQEETEAIFFRKAHAMHAPILFADTIFSEARAGHNIMLINQSNSEMIKLKLDLLGSYQYKNAKAVLLACHLLTRNGFVLDKEKNEEALSKVKVNTGMKGRFDIQSEKPRVIYDVSHNEAGIKLTLAQIEKMQYGQLHIVCGFVKDKDVRKALLAFPAEAHFYFTQAKVPRALSVDELVAKAKELDIEGHAFAQIQEALNAAKEKASEQDIILVIGSFFILEELY